MGSGQGRYAGDGGPATAAKLNFPIGVAVDPSGAIYIADSENNRVRKIGPPGARLSSLMAQSDVAFSEESGLVHILSGAGLHRKTVDAATGAVVREFGYDPDGRLTSIVDRFGNRTVIECDGSGNATAIVSPEGVRTGLSIDARNHLTRISYPDGRVFAFDYSADGLELRKTKPAGNSFAHAYYPAGRLSDYTDGEGGHWQLARMLLESGDVRTNVLSAEGGLTTHLDRLLSNGGYQSSVTEATGAQTTVVESADGLALASTLACGMSREEAYDLDPQFRYRYLKSLTERSPSGLQRVTEVETVYADAGSDGVPHTITRTLKVNGRTSVLTQDVPFARKTIVSPEGRAIVMETDPDTLVTERVAVPGLAAVSYFYDVRGRLVQTMTGGRSAAFGYSPQGFLDRATDAQGRTTFYSHDALGRVRQIERPDQSRIQFDYDANGSMTVLVNPLGTAHRFGYNRVNRNSSYTTPLSGSYQYRYDRDRRPTETEFPSGRVIRHVYDRGRLARTETPEGVVYFDYLCGGKLVSATSGNEGIAYAYDGSLLTAETASGTLNQSIAYAYDNDFGLIQATYAGQATAYGYDGDGLLIHAGSFSIARDPGNGIAVAVSDGRLAVNRGFSAYGEHASQALAVGGRALSSFGLLRDEVGRIVRRSENVGGAAAVCDYFYDANGRLAKVLKNNATVEEYAYDENGTRVFEMNAARGIAGRSYQYSAEDHLLKAGDYAYQYDSDGFLTQKATTANPANRTRYAYSTRGELLAVFLPDGRRIDYVCDPLGRRIGKKVNGVLVERYLWQGLTRLLAVYDGNGALLQRFEYADERMPVAMQAGGATYYLAFDQVGTLRAVADASGNVVKRITYDSFGNVLEDTNPSFTMPFGFAGGLHDRDTGLVRFGYRDYDPEVGRWTAKDPIGFAGGDTDLYGYVLNAPENVVDVNGLWGEDVHSGLNNASYGTYIWALQMGLTANQAKLVAFANTATDNFWSWAPIIGVPGRHFDTAHGSFDSRDVHANYDMAEAIKLYNSGNPCGAYNILGRGLHSVQDKYAHMGWVPLLPHPDWYDDAGIRRGSLSATEMATKSYLRQFIQGTSQ